MRGADPAVVRRALADGDPFPGVDSPPVRGFAGVLDEGPSDSGAGEPRLARDVLGREPLFVDGSEWAFDLRELDDPRPFPAGAAGPAEEPESVWALPEPVPFEDDQRAVGAVREALRGALDDAPDCPVAFSGGVDSTLVAAWSDGPLYVVGFPESHDVEAARDAARALDAELRVVELDHATLERVVPLVARATSRTNPMDVSIAVPLYVAAERAAADGYDRLAVGQGADELFGGYAKVAKAPEDPRVDADTVRGARREVLGTLPEQLPRDVLAMRAAGAEPVAPLLDDRVVDAALRLPGHLLVDEGDERKVALRRAAEPFVPDRVATRDKKALQYGSLVSRELDRLARQAGFKRRMDDHVGKYVQSLLDGD